MHMFHTCRQKVQGPLREAVIGVLSEATLTDYIPYRLVMCYSLQAMRTKESLVLVYFIAYCAGASLPLFVFICLICLHHAALCNSTIGSPAGHAVLSLLVVSG